MAESQEVEIFRDEGNLFVKDHSGLVILEEASSGRASVSVTCARVSWYPILVWWRFRKKLEPWREASGDIDEVGNGWILAKDSQGIPVAELREECSGNGVVEGKIRIPEGVSDNWIRWRLKAHEGERFLGFGERFNAVDQTGNKLYVWTEEGAYGLGERLGPLFEGKPWNPFPNGPTTAYKPMPFFISTRGYGLLIETTARVEYDVCSSDPGVLEVVVWDRSFRWILFYGSTPFEVVRKYTAYTGRATLPAPWVFAPWNDAIFGSGRVREVARKLREAKIPTTAIWTEDWQGGFFVPSIRRKKGFYTIFPIRYKVDRTLYPDARELSDELHRNGFRWLSYFFPYIKKGSREYREGREKGYFLKNRRGGTSHIPGLWHRYGHIDLTFDEAKRWYMEFLEENVRTGFDGWMADFGEYVPPGSITSTGKSGLLHHNEFPLLWQKMHRELLDSLRPDGDYVFFCRSASVGSQKYAPVFWSGDSNTDFEKYDGLPSNLPAVLSAGLCGLPFWAADIAGYVVATKARDKELFYRWTEFATFLSVMRTHHGTKPLSCWQFDTDEETLEFFGEYARLHTALFPYIYKLAYEACETGIPPVRHLILHYPEDERAVAVGDEFLLGDRVLVAPVLKRGARGRSVYFPPDEWIDYWSGEGSSGPLDKIVSSPIEHIPVYLRKGSILPTLDLPVDTLACVEPDSGLIGFDEALSTIRFTQYSNGKDSMKLWDGTDVKMWRSPGISASDLQEGTVVFEEGRMLEEGAPDELQPKRRKSADLVISASGESIKFKVTDLNGGVLASASYKSAKEESSIKRKCVTFEWR